MKRHNEQFGLGLICRVNIVTISWDPRETFQIGFHILRHLI